MTGVPCPERNEVIYGAANGASNMRWAYGVTTVPDRFSDLLPQTLESLRGAGFANPRLFIDGCREQNVPCNLHTNYEVTCRYPKVRTHGNWFLALTELFIRDSGAERYAIFQDDFVTYRNLRQYLERCPYPDGTHPGPPYSSQRGYWNLYTFPSNQELCPQDNSGAQRTGWYESNQNGRGAVALIFDNEAAVQLLQSKHMVERPRDLHRGWKAVDGGIVDSMRKVGYKEYVHNPSLTQHLGMESTTVPGKPQQKQAISFRGAEFDAMQLLLTS